MVINVKLNGVHRFHYSDVSTIKNQKLKRNCGTKPIFVVVINNARSYILPTNSQKENVGIH